MSLEKRLFALENKARSGQTGMALLARLWADLLKQHPNLLEKRGQHGNA